MSLSVTFHNIDQESTMAPVANSNTPPFEAYTEDIATLRQRLEPYQQYRNILLVANGGSVWSFMSYYTALVDRVAGKTVVPLTDMEPDYLAIVKQKYAVADTLVIVISKSGSTVGLIENLFALSEYPQLLVTDVDSPLGQIGAKKGVTVIAHPPVGGRYSGLTSCAYVPAILCGLDVESIEMGARAAYAIYRDENEADNIALQVAQVLWQLEQSDYDEVFMPVYSNFLQTFGMQVTQLFHESFGKDGKGLTVVAAQAPESQHHTNQRFFGGKKNMIGLFLRSESQKSDIQLEIPAEFQEIPLRTGKLADSNGASLAASFESEYIGTLTDARNQGIPLIDVAVSEVSAKTVGELMGFWHYVTVYSSLLRGVDPYDQPQVENSKVISFEERLKKS
jgi:glucose-6-phosphate isomerase